MDGLRRPVGDEEPRVYWVRRAVVLVAIAVLAVVIWLVIRGLTSSGDEGTDSPAPDTTTSPTVTQSAGAQAVDNDPSRPCTAEDVQVTSVASPTQVNVGSMPAFEVSVEHVGSAACKLSTTSDGTAMVIRSGEDKYYDSTWCPDTPLFADAEWILQPGDREAVQATWTGQRYSESCEPQGEAAAGYYLSAISIGGIAAAEAQFQMVS
ncbi:hypothetical protein [Demequina sp. NBRC 110056]|uniref:hypothetical protein n=1 Tax=Demequina sp. NBRC 110056 TaxID=1570345 RepID=UPI000A000745|nr:hypothetical protein [Demequina sp. NBRC 110056]